MQKIFRITWPDLYGSEWIQPEHVRYAICKTFRKNVFGELVIDEIPSEITDAKKGEGMKTKRDLQKTINELNMNIRHVREQCTIWADAKTILTELLKDVSSLFDDRLGAVQEQYDALAAYRNKLNIEKIQFEDELNTIGSEVRDENS